MDGVECIASNVSRDTGTVNAVSGRTSECASAQHSHEELGRHSWAGVWAGTMRSK